MTLRLALLLAAGAAQLAAAAPLAAQTDSLDALVRAEMQRQRIPGVAVGVFRNGAVVAASGWGLANVEHQVPVTPLTVFQSGSVGKQFTAAAVLLLVEDRKLRLDDPITKHLDGAPDAWQEITVRHLLTHTSGIRNYTDEQVDYRRDYAEPELVQMAAALPLDFPPGTKWSYSNTGYVLLGVIVRTASGQFYGDFLKERVFAPLDMRTARVISEDEVIPHRAAGYRLADGALRNQQWVAPTLNTTADGSLYLTLDDMAKWDAALYGDTLLTARSRTAMWTPMTLVDSSETGYGFGWALGETHGRRTIEHGGAWQGFKSHIARYPDDTLTVVVFANLAQADAGRIARAVAGLYDADLRPPARVFVTLDSTVLDRYVGRYQLDPKTVITIARAGTELEARVGIGRRLALRALSEREFLAEEEDARMLFETDDTGAVTQLVLHWNGSTPARRLPTP